MDQSLSHGSASDDTPLPTAVYTNDGQPILFYVKALYGYSAEIAQEFDFRAGDLIAVTDTSEDGWWRGELVDEARRRLGQHIFPSNYVSVSLTGSDRKPILFYVKALYDYTAETNEEFDFKEGDLIAVMDAPEHGWWEGELVDEKRRRPGRHMFPSNFVSSPPNMQSAPSSRSMRSHTQEDLRMYTDDGQRILFYAKALYDYSATIDEEFDFRAGDLIAVTDAPQDGWWNGELVDATRRETGRDVFPSNFVSLL